MEALDIREKGGVKAGVQQTSDRRLFMQLLAFVGLTNAAPLVDELSRSGFESVLYEDINDPQGVALLTWDDDPNFFVNILRPYLNDSSFRTLTLKPEYTMMGRTYALGHEPNLEEWLLTRCPKVVTDPEWRWAVWYPLRRKGDFSALPQEEQTALLREHGRIGHSFGDAGFAHDVRLASFGIDKNDNDFVIGLIGKELFPLSACVQAMRRTRQTSSFMEKMGPFFTGRAISQNLLR
jgi:chlorite dismutase